MEQPMKSVKPRDADGWSIVRHIVKEDVGSDGESVEVISDESDSNYSSTDEVPDIIPDDEYGDEPELAVFDPVGTLLRRFSDKLHELDLLPVQFNEHRRNSAHCSDIIYALVRHGLFVSGLLAVACSVLVASYLVHKVSESYSENKSVQPSSLALEELEQVVRRLQNSLKFEDEQQLKELLLKVPPGVIQTALQSGQPKNAVEKDLTGRKDRVASNLLSRGTENPGEPENSVTQIPSSNEELQTAEVTTSPTAEARSLPSPTRIEPTPALGKGGKNSTKLPDSQSSESLQIKLDAEFKDKLLSTKKEIQAVEKQIYFQVMSSLFEYKIELLKVLMKAKLDTEKPSGNNLDVIKKIQDAVFKGSESNFELWNKYYFNYLRPKFENISKLLDSLAVERGDSAPSSNHRRNTDDFLSDNQFVPGSSSEAKEETKTPERVGFDWKNLNSKIRESLKKARKEELKKSSGQSPWKLLNSKMKNLPDPKIAPSIDPVRDEVNDTSSPKIERKEEIVIMKTPTPGVIEQNKLLEPGSISHSDDEVPKNENREQRRSNEKKHNCGEFSCDYDSSKRKKKEPYGKKCGKKGKECHHDGGKKKQKNFLDNMTKYVSKAATGLWQTVGGGLEHYGGVLKNWTKTDQNQSQRYDEWRKQFVGELKDVMRVLSSNPTLESLQEMKENLAKYMGEGLGKLVSADGRDDNIQREDAPPAHGPEGIRKKQCNGKRCEATSDDESSADDMLLTEDNSTTDDSSTTDDEKTDEDRELETWYGKVARRRAELRRLDPSDASWFLDLGRHRSRLRRQPANLDDDGSWFISAARHRARMRGNSFGRTP
ncbi:Hypothetical protein NTJ_10817 [Nesidiocoris tenuis]|uniref:Uncharacterized protein n=2 Tax=Nesidiocoris tenuis TaxID=355587 RepID=A0ABN7B5G5_9HEMI|nr:Hypothetical protein NTJ_10817 [Nesidiocoris tenuis]